MQKARETGETGERRIERDEEEAKAAFLSRWTRGKQQRTASKSGDDGKKREAASSSQQPSPSLSEIHNAPAAAVAIDDATTEIAASTPNATANHAPVTTAVGAAGEEDPTVTMMSAFPEKFLSSGPFTAGKQRQQSLHPIDEGRANPLSDDSPGSSSQPNRSAIGKNEEGDRSSSAAVAGDKKRNAQIHKLSARRSSEIEVEEQLSSSPLLRRSADNDSTSHVDSPRQAVKKQDASTSPSTLSSSSSFTALQFPAGSPRRRLSSSVEVPSAVGNDGDGDDDDDDEQKSVSKSQKKSLGDTKRRRVREKQQQQRRVQKLRAETKESASDWRRRCRR